MRDELDQLLEPASDDIRRFSGAHVFMTGGTGFVGKNFLESVAWANDRLGCGIRLTILTRDPNAFATATFAFERNDMAFLRGDVRTFRDAPRVDAVVHAATPASAAINAERPLEMLDTIVEGGRNVLEFAARSGRIPLLFTSSGAVYGKQPEDLPHRPEASSQGPDQLAPTSAYAEGKRIAELQCALFSEAGLIDAKIARLFAFVGPYLPLDRHFAAGNFLRDALAGREIRVKGDGSTIRSYMYSTEMVAWLWAILARGTTGRAYNVGSEEPVTIRELATLVSDIAGGSAEPVRIEGASESTVDRYVPSTARIREELKLKRPMPLRDALERTLLFQQRR